MLITFAETGKPFLKISTLSKNVCETHFSFETFTSHSKRHSIVGTFHRPALPPDGCLGRRLIRTAPRSHA